MSPFRDIRAWVLRPRGPALWAVFLLAAGLIAAPGHARANVPLGPLEGTLAVRAIALSSTTPFDKWTGMLDRHRQTRGSSAWRKLLTDVAQAAPSERLATVNRIINDVAYRDDRANWAMKDYWASPAEFLNRGGDCEDFATAKYLALRALGYDDTQLFVLTYHDSVQRIAHTVLLVADGDQWVVLDNLRALPTPLAAYGRVRPFYMLNQSRAWWLSRAS